MLTNTMNIYLFVEIRNGITIIIDTTLKDSFNP